MLNNKYSYLLHISFLGFRYHGWQKQKDQKTIQHMLERTIKHILPSHTFKTIGCSRTDAMVSAEHFVCELLIDHELHCSHFLDELNQNLPADICALKVENKPKNINIIKSVKQKHYSYTFYFSTSPSPFHAPRVGLYRQNPSFEKMHEVACLFKGEHNFKSFCHRPDHKKSYLRSVDHSSLSKISDHQYQFEVIAKGFGHHQVRIMAGTMVDVMLKKISIDQVKKALSGEFDFKIGHIAPASGLTLKKVHF